jgi:hypothetical protein
MNLLPCSPKCTSKNLDNSDFAEERVLSSMRTDNKQSLIKKKYQLTTYL